MYGRKSEVLPSDWISWERRFWLINCPIARAHQSRDLHRHAHATGCRCFCAGDWFLVGKDARAEYKWRLITSLKVEACDVCPVMLPQRPCRLSRKVDPDHRHPIGRDRTISTNRVPLIWVDLFRSRHFTSFAQNASKHRQYRITSDIGAYRFHTMVRSWTVLWVTNQSNDFRSSEGMLISIWP